MLTKAKKILLKRYIELLLTILLAFLAGGFVIKLPPVQIVLIISSIICLIISLRKPEFGILLIVIAISSIVFETAIPLIPIPGGSFHVTDLLLFILLLRIPIKILTDQKFTIRKTYLDLPILLFIIAAIISAGLSLFTYEIDFNTVMRGLRPIMYYLLYFIINNSIQNHKQIHNLLNGLFFIAALVSLAMIIQTFIGESIPLMPGRVEAAETVLGQKFEATRIIPPGDSLILAMFILAACSIALIRKPLFKSGYFYLLFLIGIGILLTYSRNIWISVALSLFIFALLIRKKGKIRIMGWLVTALVLAGLLIPTFIYLGGRARSTFDSMSERFISLFTIERTFTSGSLQWRKIENEYAWRSIVRHPFLGIGLYNSYRRIIPSMDNSNKDANLPAYVHNGYLWILVDMGLFGFLPLMWFFFGFIVRGYSNWRKIRDPIEKSIVIGCTLSGTALSFCILVSPKFMEWPAIVIIATIAGLVELILQMNEKGSPKLFDKINMNEAIKHTAEF
jgi:O-antigen ligase